MLNPDFKEIPEYPEYLINEDGEVFSTKSFRKLKIQTQSTGYRYFTVTYNNKRTNVLLHRALCRVFKDLPSLDADLEVHHVDECTTNNKLSNLKVVTSAEHNKLTFGTYKFKLCVKCSKELSKNTSGDICQYCINSSRPIISLSDIEYWVKNHSWSRASRELGMSDNGLRKRYRKLSGKDPKDIKRS